MIEHKAGWYINKVTETKTAEDFAEFVANMADYYKIADNIKLVMGNHSTHTRQALIDRYGEKKSQGILDRFEFRFMQVHASWLNKTEIAIGMYQRQCLGDCHI